MKNNITFLVSVLLIFVTLNSCKKNGISLESEDVTSEIVGSKWVITRYDNTLTNQSFFPNDTLHFTTQNEYTVNNGSTSDYSYVEYVDLYANSRVLTLENCAVFGGTYSTSLTSDLIMEDEIGNLLFNAVNGNDLIVWLERVN